MTSKRGGRPSKGEREALLVRVPPEVAAAVHGARGEQTITDYVSNVLAKAHGLPMPYPPPAGDQLQMTA